MRLHLTLQLRADWKERVSPFLGSQHTFNALIVPLTAQKFTPWFFAAMESAIFSIDSWRGVESIENDKIYREILATQGNIWTIKINLASDEPSISA